MIRKQAIKKCRGTGKAKGYGCKDIKTIFRYGLCVDCYKEFLFNSPEGKEMLERSRLQGKKKADRHIKSEIRKKKADNKKFNLYNSPAWKWCRKYVLLYYADSNCIVQCSTSPEQSYHVT